jgi:hypothetical protein
MGLKEGWLKRQCEIAHNQSRATQLLYDMKWESQNIRTSAVELLTIVGEITNRDATKEDYLKIAQAALFLAIDMEEQSCQQMDG